MSKELSVDQLKMIAAFWPLALAFSVMIALAWLKILLSRWMRSFTPLADLDRVDSMSGEDFEKWLRALFEQRGWKVRLTPDVGDYGADLLLEKDGSRVAVQAKRWKRQVGIKAVQEALAARDFYRTDKAWVITNSTFTQAAEKQAKASGVILLDRSWLADALKAECREQRKKGSRASLKEKVFGAEDGI